MVLDEARDQAREELQRVRSELRRLRRELMSQGAPAKALEEFSQAVDALEKEVPPVPQAVAAPRSSASEPVRVGDTVYVASLDQSGELLSLDEDEAEVRLGSLRLRTEPEALEFRSRPEAPAPSTSEGIRTPNVASPGMELDLRGLRAEEAGQVVERYLNDAYLAALPWVRIIHGKGTGVLKSVVRQALSASALVASFRPGELTEGGDGVTVAQLHKLNE
jgi:DNA mismatch repair protein MutS2